MGSYARQKKRSEQPTARRRSLLRDDGADIKARGWLPGAFFIGKQIAS